MLGLTFQAASFSERVSDYLATHRNASKGLLAASFMAAGLRSGREGPLAVTSLTQTFRTARHPGALFRMLRTINRIDDVVDNMTADKRIALGEAKHGNTPCEFLMAPPIRNVGFLDDVETNARQGVMSAAENISFGNIYSILLKRGALAEKNFMETREVTSREIMTESNLQIAQVLGGHILHYFMPSKTISTKAGQGRLVARDVLEAYPHALHYGRLIELTDDFEDFFTDLEREAETGILTPNWIATDMVRNGTLYSPDGSLKPDVAEFLARHHDDPDGIPFRDLPRGVQNAITRAEDEVMRESAYMPGLERKSLAAVWDGILKGGLKSSAHPDTHKGSVFEAGTVRTLG